MEVSLLTGGDDKPYVFGLVNTVIKNSVSLEVVGGDGLDFPEWQGVSGLRFLNLRRRLNESAGPGVKLWRLLASYVRLVHYAWIAKPLIFHIIWNNKFEYFDRTAMMMYYKWVLRKSVLFTAHNVNKAKRDLADTYLNRLTLKAQYWLCDLIFVHTDEMKQELIREFGCDASKIMVVPFGINNAVPHTDLTPAAAKARLGVGKDEKAILFFGRIVPYKGLEYLVAAFQDVLPDGKDYRLIIAGRPEKDCLQYFERIRERVNEGRTGKKVTLRIEYVPDEETEVFFKAADVLVLPYRNIYQSGVLFLAYSFGLPVIVSDVGGLRSEVVEGKTGFLCRPEDPSELGKTIEKYFSGEFFGNLGEHRRWIQKYAHDRYSWDAVGELTASAYKRSCERACGNGKVVA